MRMPVMHMKPTKMCKKWKITILKSISNKLDS